MVTVLGIDDASEWMTEADLLNGNAFLKHLHLLSYVGSGLANVTQVKFLLKSMEVLVEYIP